MNNVTGWNEMMDGNLVKASFTMFDAAVGGWFVTIIFFAYLALLMYKTKSASAVTIGGILFVGLYTSYLKVISMPIIVMIIGLTLAAIIFYFYNKKQ